MTVNPFASLSVTPTAPSRAAKPAVSASSDGFDAMVADVMADEDVKTVTSSSAASSDAPPLKADETPKEADTSVDETSEDAGYSELLSAATLFVVQPQAPQPTADGAGNAESMETDTTAGVRTASPAAVTIPAPMGADFAAELENSAPITPANLNVAPTQMVGPNSAASAIAAENAVRITPANPNVAPLVMMDPKSVAPASASGNTAEIASADADAALAQPADPDGAASTTTPKTLTAGAEERPHIDHLVAASIAREPVATLVPKAAATALPLAAETGQPPPQSTISDSADQTTEPVHAERAAASALLTDAPARVAGSAIKDAVSNASAGGLKSGAQSTAASEDAKAGSSPSTVSGQAQTGQIQTGQVQMGQTQMGQASPSAATAAFAAQVQAQANASDPLVVVTTDTVPTAQSQQTVQTNTISTTPVTASFSGLSRATLETTIQIAAQITRQLAGRSTRFEMGLTPEGLGKVNVSMDIDAGGQLTAQLAFDNPLAAADLRARVDELRGQLQDAGFKLADDALTFSHQDASSRDGSADQRPDQNQGRAFAAASRMADDADLVPPIPAWVSLSLTPRGVDMKV